MVDSTELNSSQIESGRELLERLDNTGSKPTTCMWFFVSGINSWKLIIAPRNFNETDIPSNYVNFNKAISDNQAADAGQIGLNDITLISPDDDLIKLLSMAVITNPDSKGGIRFKSNTINGVYIEDAYIYRLTRGNYNGIT